jgi:predicted nucleic acid-binding protein
MSFVLDNSVLFGWFLANQADSTTEAIASRLVESQAWAPPLLQLEWINVLRSCCRRGRITLPEAREIIDRVAALPIRIDTTVPSPPALLALSLRHNLSSYDAADLDLALRLQMPIATRDHDLIEVAWAAGVGVMKG